MHDTVERARTTGGTLTNLRCFVLDRCLVRRFSRLKTVAHESPLSMNYPLIICIVLRFGGLLVNRSGIETPFSILANINNASVFHRFPPSFSHLLTLSFAFPLRFVRVVFFFFFLIHENDPTVLSDRSILYYGTFDSVSRLGSEIPHGPSFTGHKTL